MKKLLVIAVIASTLSACAATKSLTAKAIPADIKKAAEPVYQQCLDNYKEKLGDGAARAKCTAQLQKAYSEYKKTDGSPADFVKIFKYMI